MPGRYPFLLCTAALALHSQTTPVDFTKDVQPILQKSCYSCHADKLQMGRLRLDSKAAALNGGQSGKILQPGKAAESSLYQRIAGIGDQARMPMGAKPLDAAQIAMIKNWIDQGATWPDTPGAATTIKKHWTFIPPVRPSLPAVKAKAWTRNPIDAFILARLEKEGLQPSKESDRVTLLRRLSLDLIGLPPTPQEVDAFLNDKSPNAYLKQVERLLASPHYGERWGRHWLDAARYADSDGFEKDKMRSVWFWRDWVINAFNRDLPYNQFITHQLAGDLLPNATQEQKVATGFLRNSMINEEGGVDPEQFRMEAMFDRMDAIGKSMLGFTVQCAQCHNHKYDPILQEDYYKLFAFLNNSHESNIAVYTPEEQQKRAEIFRKTRELEATLQHNAPDWQSRMAAWENSVRDNQPQWIVVRPEVDDISTGGQKYLPQADGSFLAQGYAPTKHRVKMTVKTDLKPITAFRLELLNDPNLPLNGPGRSLKGTAALTQFDVEAAPAADKSAKPALVKLASATADQNLPERELEKMFFDKSKKRRVTGPIAYAIDDNDDTAWGTDAGPGRSNVPRNAVFVAAKPVSHDGGTVLTFYLKQNHGGWNSDDNMSHNLGRFRLSITSAPNAVADPLPSHVRELLAIAKEQRSPAQTQAIFSYFRTTVPEWKQTNDQIEALWQQHPAGSSQLILNERNEMRPTHLLTRGDFLKPAKAVQPGVPAFLNPLPKDAPPNRLGLAMWITDRNAPTTARAMVNRIWQAYFGTGIVATSEDLGQMSEAPSHQELLDWLAVEFMDRKWSIKAMHRLIVNSATYRQSSSVTPELYQKDPFNRLLARGPRLRVEGEIVRDITLAASGLLNAKVGGPSVFPSAPEFLFLPPASYGPKNWYEDKGPDRYRRAIYTFRYRSVPYPMLQNFDTPNGDMSCLRRSRSNTPLQALTTLNEPMFIETARALAKKTLAEGGASDAERLTYAFRRCVSRTPSAQERAELQSLLERQTQRFREGKLNSAEMTGGEANPDLAGWTAVARVLLNLDETITKE